MRKASYDDWNGTRLQVGNANIHIMGDPHLGRRFVNDVPIHRRGEREKLVRDAFDTNLVSARLLGADVHVCMGDLFDQPVVDPGAVLFAANAYIDAASASPTCHFVVIAGNHDLSRNIEQVTSFDLFAAMVGRNCSNIIVVQDFPLTVHYGAPLTFFPWSPTKPAKEMVEEEFQGRRPKAEGAVFGHWDVAGPDTNPNLIPHEQILQRTTLAVTGHDHLCRVERRGDLDVLVTGSLLPYAHGEDASGTIYKTLTKEEFERADPASFRDCCVRVILEPGESLSDMEIDALQFKVVRKAAEQPASARVEFESGFDLRTLFDKVMEEGGVSANLRDDLRKRLLAS